jgi:hypothetical protein
MLTRIAICSLVAAGLAAVVVGCAKRPEPAAEVKGPTTAAATGHGHKEGPHQGTIVEVGRDNYHVEIVFGKEGLIQLYTLGKDEAAVHEVDKQSLEAYASPEPGNEVSLVFEPDPQKGDPAGKTTRFTARLPMDLWGKAVAITVPIHIDGTRFRFAFNTTAAADDTPLEKVQGNAEKTLYLTPGGKYTEADIKANGNTTPSEKFKGQKSVHDMKPAPGDRVCPITRTKANPKFAWIVGGKEYEFCCPPCIDEFVQEAKDTPELIKEPDAYRKKQ